uniref:Sphingomyelin phosphodiesterase n=1 Tax=Culicoides sonorensis TaxID=179676 RepID=A0A336LTD4_CULSO
MTKQEGVDLSNNLVSSEKIEKEFYEEFTKLIATGDESEKLKSLYEVLRLPDELRYINDLSEVPEELSIVYCLTCRTTVSTFLNLRRRENQTLEQLSNYAYELCINLNVQTSTVCRNMIDQMAPILLYLVDNYPELSSYDTCAIVAQSENCGPPRNEMFDLEIEIASGGPEITGHKKGTPYSGEFYKIIHIGDIHYDPDYVVSGNANCKEPTCCRYNQGAPANEMDAAGRWGDYRNCDMPYEMIQNAFRTMWQLHNDADHIYFSGDIIDHGVWETSIESNILKIETIQQLMKDEFQNIPIYQTLGNHEAHPVNIYAPSFITEAELSTQWLYDYTADAWFTWLPSESLETVKKGGYYTTLIAPNYRLIVLNNNECYVDNFWMLAGSNQLKDQLQWLHDTLLRAEANNEKVHIMRHIPSGSSCFRYWDREYNRIINRFYHIISAQFEGHTHKNEIELFYDTENVKHALNVAFNGGSLTTYTNLNPNFMVFYVDKQSLEVIDFESYMFNLTEANLHPYQNPHWFKSYSFKKTWNLPDLSPESMNGLVERLVADDNENYTYWTQRIKNGEPYLQSGCQGKCLENNVCRIVTTSFGDNRKCKELYSN